MAATKRTALIRGKLSLLVIDPARRGCAPGIPLNIRPRPVILSRAFTLESATDHESVHGDGSEGAERAVVARLPKAIDDRLLPASNGSGAALRQQRARRVRGVDLCRPVFSAGTEGQDGGPGR